MAMGIGVTVVAAVNLLGGGVHTLFQSVLTALR
jgi:Flp pilus assembly pilin Flp